METVNSPWVRKEIDCALEVERQRKDDGYRVIPLLLPGIATRALGNWFDEEPLAVPVQLGPGGLSEAMPAILAALGESEPADTSPPPVPVLAPVDELVLELRDPKMATGNGQRRARATATLVYKPADAAVRQSMTSQRFTFTAPLGPIELQDIRWYLEEYALWPVGVFKERAERTEKQLPAWGKALYDAVLGVDTARDSLAAWTAAGIAGLRRFSVWVEDELPQGASKKRQAEANEAASALLSLPWELLHDGAGYLMHGRHASHVRRQLPNRSPQARQLARRADPHPSRQPSARCGPGGEVASRIRRPPGQRRSRWSPRWKRWANWWR